MRNQLFFLFITKIFCIFTEYNKNSQIMLITDIQNCSCGALTVYWENGTNTSMLPETFTERFPVAELKETLNKSINCNHCVNHWGIDLCGCGSGETKGECSESFEECKSGTASQELFVNKKFVGWV